MKLCTFLAVILTMTLALSTPAQARYYQAETGRYLTADPIGLEGGIDPFVYTDNNPVNRVDPEGNTSATWDFFWPAIPALWPVVAPVLIPAVVAGGLVVGAGVIIMMTPAKTACDEEVASNVVPFRRRLDDFCREERKRCAKLCSEAVPDFNRPRMSGKKLSQCMKNCLPEQCGGEPKWKGYKEEPRQREWNFD